jgi:transcriptional regulator with XRE-family HTH domain
MAENDSLKAPEKFIRVLKNAMETHPEKLSLRQVARRADISPAYLSLLLSGERSAPSNDAISNLEKVLNIPEGELFGAAARPDNQALDFFRKEEAGAIIRTLAKLPKSKLSSVQKLIEKFADQKGK